MSITDTVPPQPKITHDLNKGKGLVFGYEGKAGLDKKQSSLSCASMASALVVFERSDIDRCVDQKASVSSTFNGPSVFRVGSSSRDFLSGSMIDGKRGRRHPKKWKRMARKTKIALVGFRNEEGEFNKAEKGDSLGQSGSEATSQPKRKAVRNVDDHSSKSSKTNLSSVASVLKPLPSQ